MRKLHLKHKGDFFGFTQGKNEQEDTEVGVICSQADLLSRVRRSRSAAQARLARMSSRSRDGKSSRTFSMLIPEAKCASTS